MEQGYSGSYNGDAYGSVMYQNENLSVRTSDEFMAAALSGKEWWTRTVTTGKPGNLQIRLIDPATGGTRQGRGACTGDSGGPVFADDNGQLAVIGVVSWSTGPNAGDGCGGLTGVTPLELYRGWIAETSRKIGGR